MKLVKAFLFIFIIAAFVSGCSSSKSSSSSDSQNEESYSGMIYTSEIVEAETQYLKSSSSQDDETKKRAEMLAKLEEGRRAAYMIRNIEINPVPCPVSTPHCLPLGLPITRLTIGIFCQTPGQCSMAITNKKGKQFAVGKMQRYDNKMQTAWYTFDVVNASLISESLFIKGESSFNIKSKIKSASFEIPLAPNNLTTTQR